MGVFNRLKVYFGRQWRQRRRYDGVGSWLATVYNRAVLASRDLPWPGKGAVKRVRLREYPGDFFARIGTSDLWVLEEVLLENEYGPFLARDVGELRTIVDLGANIGLTVRLWQARHPNARIVAVEPDAANVAMVERNVDRASPGQVSIVRACAGGRDRMVSLDHSGFEWAFKMRDGTGHDRAAGGAGTELVEAVTVPALLERFGIAGPIDLLKCDIEGAEAEVFADCAAWIGRVRNLVVELHAPYTPEAFAADLRRGGVEPHVYAVDDKGGHKTLFLEVQPIDEGASRGVVSAPPPKH